MPLPLLPEPHLQMVVGAVARAALEAPGREVVVLLGDGTPEAILAARILERSLPEGVLEVVEIGDPGMESVLRYGGTRAAGRGEYEVKQEALRFTARLRAGGLVASSINKTALLLGECPPDAFLPLGDVYASQVAALTGGWSAPDAVRKIADAAGGIEALDAALHRRLERRRPHGPEGLPEEVTRRVDEAFEAGRAGRLHPRIVPKIGARTVGVDLHE